jgi:hypothetical protein
VNEITRFAFRGRLRLPAIPAAIILAIIGAIFWGIGGAMLLHDSSRFDLDVIQIGSK